MATIASNASHARNPPADSEPFEAWLSDTTRGDMTWVIAGRSRSGKSTLVRNLLRRLDSGTERQVKTLEIPGLDTFADNRS